MGDGGGTEPVDPMTAAGGLTEADAVTDALRHVLMDAFSLQTLALCAAWNVEGSDQAGCLAPFRDRATSARAAAHEIARLLRRRRAAVALHPTDPSELPRWMLAAPAPEPLMRAALLAEATGEFIASLEAACEVARAAGDLHTRQQLRRRLGAELRTAAALARLFGSLPKRAEGLSS